ncbi:zinc ribbon domain-containing protein [Nonomuraea sediminis]|uniref:zinc ribbon domain-containing protein n=1 Tax=Nonomuraea sediminis TaxID=2835864 RepID=UPI001BDD6FC6|nr:zinc ribbon domain-containing protein [Nonomuraea sediminis]
MSITCPNCGDVNPDGTRFCVECGEYLAWDDRDREPEDNRLPQPEEPRPPEQHAELVAGLSERWVSVTPGEQASTTVTVRNRGTRVERVDVEVEGDAAAFATVEPDELVVPPGGTATCAISFAPPHSPSVPAGEAEFTVLARSRVSRGVFAYAEGTCIVGGFDDLKVELTPEVSRGRWATRHSITLNSRGNLTHRARLSASDPEDALRMSMPVTDLPIDPGRTVVPLRVSARPPFTGKPRELPFFVTASIDDGETSFRVKGTRVALPLIAPWAMKALVAVMGIALVAVVAIVVINLRRPEPKPVFPAGETYVAGSGALSGGYASVAVPGLSDDAKIFVTSDLSGIAGNSAHLGQPRTRELRPIGSLGVTGREGGSFSVAPIDGESVEGMAFGYLVMKRAKGTIGGMPYEAGSGSIPQGENSLDVPADTVKSGSVILLTVELAEPSEHEITGLKVDAKNDGVFTVATLDLSPTPVDVGFNWVVIDSGDPSLAGVNTTDAMTDSGDPVRIRSPLADGSGIILLTTDAAPRGFAGVAMPGVCVGSQGDGAFTVEWFSDRITVLPTDFDYLIVQRRE